MITKNVCSNVTHFCCLWNFTAVLELFTTTEAKFLDGDIDGAVAIGRQILCLYKFLWCQKGGKRSVDMMDRCISN